MVDQDCAVEVGAAQVATEAAENTAMPDVSSASPHMQLIFYIVNLLRITNEIYILIILISHIVLFGYLQGNNIASEAVAAAAAVAAPDDAQPMSKNQMKKLKKREQ